MTTTAVAGTVHKTLPAGFEDWEVGALDYVVIPWFCPTCHLLMAESVVPVTFEGRTLVDGIRRDLKVKTVLEFSPVRQRSADQGGIPFYGPSSRWRRGRQERTDRRHLFNASDDRANVAQRSISYRVERVPRDHHHVEVPVFETLCVNCPNRVVIDIAKAVAPAP